MSKSNRTSPRKFAEKIALHKKREADSTAEYEKILQEVEATTRATNQSPRYPSRASSSSSWLDESSTGNSNMMDPVLSSTIVTPTTYNYNELNNYCTDDPFQSNTLEHNQNHHHHQEQQQYQNQLLVPPTNCTNDHMIENFNSRMRVVPDIEISHFTTDEQEQDGPIYYTQQIHSSRSFSHGPVRDNHHHQQQQMGSGNRNDYSTIMSSARSLPDIVNLRVTSPIGGLIPSFSDQRISSNTVTNHNYDVNYNIMPNNQQQSDHTNGYYANNQTPIVTQQHYQGQQVTEATYNHSNPHNNNYGCNSPDHFYHQPPQGSLPIHYQGAMPRANSTSNVSEATWTNDLGDNLCAPKVNNYLSRSSDACCNVNIDLDADQSCSWTMDSMVTHSPTMRLRSNSYNEPCANNFNAI